MHIKYFSWVRDQIGVESENITLSNEITSVNDLLKHLKNKSEKHNKALIDISVIRCAVNMEVVNLDFSINDADEIALFPPMTGG
jgi:molybdopterin synthase sulfur carrier subunit